MKSSMQLNTRTTVLVVLIMLLAIPSTRAASKGEGLCDELRKVSKQGGFVRYALDGVEDTRPTNIGKQLIPNVDIDGDDVNDELLWLPQGSGSAIPADPSDIAIKLSKTGREITFEAMRFFLFRYHSKIFIAASRRENINDTSIYKVNPEGVELVCNKL